MTRSISAIFILSLVWTNANAGEPEPPEPNPSGPTILHDPVTTAPTGQPIRVRADITDPDGVFAPAVYVRAQGSDRYVSIPMKLEDGVYAAVVPAELVVQDLEYFVEAFDELGNGPSRRGTPEAPLLTPGLGAARAEGRRQAAAGKRTGGARNTAALGGSKG